MFSSGKHCSKSDCHSLDFLPLTCPTCRHVFCGSHAPVWYHDCLPSEAVSDPVERPTSNISSIDPVRELVNTHTPARPTTDKVDPNAKAREILAKRFPSVPRERQPERRPKELSPALKMILLRRKAVSGDPRKKDADVPPESRWYGSLGFLPTVESQDLAWDEQRALAKEPRALWFDKKTVVGKVFDLTIAWFRSELTSHSHSCSTSDLQLFTIRLGNQRYIITEQCSLTWGEAVKDGEEVWLTGYKTNVK